MPKGHTFTEKELLRKLRMWAKQHGHSPSTTEIRADKSMPAPSVYQRHFGSWNRAKELAGLKLYNRRATKLDRRGAFLDEWVNERMDELSDTTLKNYLKILYSLETFLADRGKKLEEMEFQDIKEYIDQISNANSRSTLILKTNAIKNLFSFEERRAILKGCEPRISPVIMEEVKKHLKRQLRNIVEFESTKTEALSEEQVATIKEKLKHDSLLFMMFQLDLQIGLRANEFKFIKAKVGHIKDAEQGKNNGIWIDLDEGTMLIFRKKRKYYHLVALTKEMVELVKRQLRLRKLFNVKHDGLFFTIRGKVMTANNVIKYYEKISKIVGFRVTSHIIRRTMTTLLESRGITHSIIRIRIGHSAKDTTEIYKKFPLEERRLTLSVKVGLLGEKKMRLL